MTDIIQAAQLVQDFEKDSLADQISAIETILQGANAEKFAASFRLLGIDPGLLDAALTMKSVAREINVIIHAVGILLAIPKILADDERVISLSLGAGSTGKNFDLETSQRVAEFKFIQWKGGSEAIRQNSLFKDFYLLAEYDTDKVKELYVVGTKYPMKFLNGGRSLSSVMSRNRSLWDDFSSRYESRFEKVSEFYRYRKGEVVIRDVSQILPSLASIPGEDEEE